MIQDRFEEMGTKVRINKIDENPRARRTRQKFNIDIRNGEFIINKEEGVEIQVIDFDKKDRHLLLMASIPAEKPGFPFEKQRYLCGHDERDWFTCAIPTVAKTVFEAKETLKPKEILDLENGKIKNKNKQKRHRKVKGVGKIHRQGEFMFVPVPDWSPDKNAIILKKEPMRSNGRPHVAEEVVRKGGRVVYTLGNRVMEESNFKEFQKRDPKQASLWRNERENPTVYARGTIRHPDHKTLNLGDIWHKVLVNTESEAKFISNVRFID